MHAKAIERFGEAAREAGWIIVPRDPSLAVALPEEISRRFGGPPPSYEPFLSSVATACNGDESIWFLTEERFAATDPTGFVWNELEKISLDSADEEDRPPIVAFWDRHFPIMMAPNGDYDFLAIVTNGPDEGRVVHGYAPEFEDVSVVAGCFDDCLASLTEALRSEVEPTDLTLRLFVGR